MNRCPLCSTEVSLLRRYLTPGRLPCRACGAQLKVEPSKRVKWIVFAAAAPTVGMLAILADRQMNGSFTAVAIAAMVLVVWSGAQGELIKAQPQGLRELAVELRSRATTPIATLAKVFWWFLQTVALVLLFLAGIVGAVVLAHAA